MTAAGAYTARRRQAMPSGELGVGQRRGKPRALVAGGAGFIGGNLCTALLARGYAVRCVDNLITGRVETANRLAENTDFHFIKGDVANRRVAARLLRTRYDEVYDLACPTGVPNIALLGEEMLLTSSLATRFLTPSPPYSPHPAHPECCTSLGRSGLLPRVLRHFDSV